MNFSIMDLLLIISLVKSENLFEINLPPADVKKIVLNNELKMRIPVCCAVLQEIQFNRMIDL